ncbi:hypothetical protein [Caulobacter segnis]|uniref:Uncharacterized protein n=1 Tax=Caulobacter segnis TaxID=88688 RepID=A0A2W5VM85_9CAUL|nr:hypothetical protein [Caulobacter segnis]PZR36485.1 MAG: hypothetical protein DI526_03350 [Caulobacter segnis]
MDIKITGRGVYGADGEYEIGTVIAGLEAEPTSIEGRYDVVGDEGARVLVTNPAATPAGGAPYDVRETSPGWFQIYDASGAEVGKKLRKDDAEAFAALTDEEKADFLKGEA